MRLIAKIALVLTLVACKKPDAMRVQPAAGSSGSGSGGAVTLAASVAAPILVDAAIMAPKVWRVPAATKAVRGDADATVLGTVITAHFVERVTNLKEGGWRHVKTVLVLEGNGVALAADETDEGSAQDAAKATLALAGEPDIVLPPLTPPRPFTGKDLPNDAMPVLDFKGPLLFVVSFTSKGEERVLAVAHNQDTIVVWTMIAARDSIDVAPSWEATGTIKLAPGAKVDAPGLVAPTAAAAPVGGTLAAAALDELLASQRVDRDHVAKRADQPRSQWAVVEGKRVVAGALPASYTVIRVTAAGPSTLELVAPGHDAWFDGVSAIDVKDLDLDGVDDAVITATWERQRSQRELTTTETVEQVYVVGGAQLCVGAQHASHYKTETNLGPGENPQPEESIELTYSIANGTLHVEKGAFSIEHKRVKGLLDPRRDPLLVPGELSITFSPRR